MKIGLWQIQDLVPRRLQPSEVELEKHLEDWIARDPDMLERGLVIVARQLRTDAGPLDLLALDFQGRWVLIEIKRERLRREVIAQAIDYASCLATLSPDGLREECNAYLKRIGHDETLDDLLDARGASLGSGGGPSECVIYLVGTSADPGLERIVGYLADRHEMAIRAVTFFTFQSEGGEQILGREIHESDAASESGRRQSARPAVTVESVLKIADSNGVGQIVRGLHKAATEVGLHTRAWPSSLMFAPQANRTRCIFYVWAKERKKRPGVALGTIAADAFEQFFGIPEERLKAETGLGEGQVDFDKATAERFGKGLIQLLGTSPDE